MTMLRLLPMIALLAVAICPCRADTPAGHHALTTAAEIRTQKGLNYNADCVLRLTGIVTLVDASRNMLVLQDATGAVALHGDLSHVSVQPGQRVSLSATSSAPFVSGFPDYPYRPSGREILPTFGIPENEGFHRLTRMRGWLRPPVTGEYTFWISSDDSSELWLSTSARPEDSSRVASLPPGRWTDPRDWNRFPSQRSEKVSLRAGESYYIEALQEQLLVGSHLDVAWEGPDQKQAVIDGRFLVPWDTGADGLPGGAKAGGSNGIFREYWTDYSVGNLGPITSASRAEGDLAVSGLKLSVLEDGVWPETSPIEPGQGLQADDTYRWVEGEGAVGFMATDGATATLEIVSGQNRLLVRVADWKGKLPPPGVRMRAKFKGVCEGGRDPNWHLIAGYLWAPSDREVSFIEETNGQLQTSPDALGTPTSDDATLGGYYFTRGVVTFSDRVLGKDCLFVQEAFGGVFISQKERKLHPPLQVGQGVEIGGNFLPRKYAPAISPTAINALGWQGLPTPVISSGEASYRDGQWTEIEGVARSVNSDGTMILSGRQSSVPVWVGRSDRDILKKLVDCTLRIRGVMSLDTFDTPLLLVPSRDFVEIKEAALELPANPVSIASLDRLLSETGWIHQVKVAGTVTYQNDRFFFLQDLSGGVRVELGEEHAPQVGGVLEVVGFPNQVGVGPRLTEAAFRPLGGSTSLVPVRMSLENPDPAHDGTLVTIEARVLSLKKRGAGQVMELQADRQVFEAVLEAPESQLSDFAAESLVAVTGICTLDPASSSIAVQQLLLRSPADVSLLQGPPWWTWQRTALLIGILLTVLAGSLLRIQILSRRFARQQAARLAFARGMLESQESERQRIAANLHDSLGQDLLVIRNQAHLAIQASEEESALRQRLEEISTTTLQAINEVREITHNLRPYQLDRLGLTQSIRALTRKVSENCPVMFASHVDEIDGILDNESEIHIYRIVQEGINNVMKHSQATEAAVVVKRVPSGLSISIRDNGRGLAVNGASADTGFGLGGIRERAEILGGAAKIESSPGQGVTLQVQLPLQETTPCKTESKS